MKNIEEKILMTEKEIKQLQNKRKNLIKSIFHTYKFRIYHSIVDAIMTTYVIFSKKHTNTEFTRFLKDPVVRICRGYQNALKQAYLFFGQIDGKWRLF